MGGRHEDEYPPKEVPVDNVVPNVVHVALNAKREQLQDVPQENGIVGRVCRKTHQSEEAGH